MNENIDPEEQSGGSENTVVEAVPAFNVPRVIVVLAVLMLGVHLLRAYFFTPQTGFWVLTTFAFIPASYGPLAEQLPVPLSGLWSPVTYAFLHGDWTHLGMNLLWMLAFGSPVARRLGSMRFILLSLIATVSGAVLHLVFFMNDIVPVIGASGAVSGYMGAAARFAFPKPGQRGFNPDGPALSLAESFQNRQFITFLGVWMILNFLFGSGIIPLAGEDAQIAWQAHVGGFFGGILGFSLLDKKDWRQS